MLSLSGYSQTYQGIQAGKPLRKWYVAGPIKISEDSVKIPGITDQESFFNRADDQKLNVSVKVPTSGTPDLSKWKKIEAWSDNVDFDSIFNHLDFVSAYAYAVIVSDEAKPVLFAICSCAVAKASSVGFGVTVAVAVAVVVAVVVPVAAVAAAVSVAAMAVAEAAAASAVAVAKGACSAVAVTISGGRPSPKRSGR